MSISRIVIVSFNCLLLALPAFAVPISFFSNGTYVDTLREGPNLEADIIMLGHTTIPFAGITAVDFAAAAAAADIIVFPEMERSNLADDLSAAAIAELQSFLTSGGTIIQANVFPANGNLADALLGSSLVQLGNIGATNLNAGDAAGTAFAGGPAVLPGSNAVEGITTASLPAGALNIYSSFGETSVFTAGLGAGTYIYLGFDWFEEPTPAEWKDVLGRAIDSGGRVPEPMTLLLFGAGLAAIGVTRRRAS